MNDMIVMGRLIPDSGKIHQNQEVYATGGGCCTLKATTYKDPPKVMIEELYDEDLDKTSNSVTITAQDNAGGLMQVSVDSNKQYRIRRLTPRETWRLMDFTDEQFDRAKAAGLSDTQLYKQAGNSIVVSVLEQIMGNLYDAMPYLFDDLKVSSYFSGIGAFESALDRVYKNKTGDVNNV